MKFRKLIAAALAAMFCVTAAGCSGGNGSVATSGATEESAGEDVSTADEFDTSLTAMELTADIRIGWTLGNPLDATGGAGVSQETSWGNPRTTPELIQGVKDAGFNAVRIPTTWEKQMDENNTISAEWLTRVKETVDYAYDLDMYVILNMHHEEWHQPYADQEEAISAKMTTCWTQIADYFRDYDQHLIFEGMNEPRWRSTNWEWNGGNSEGRSAVNKLNECFVKAVRATGGNNSYRALMVPTYAASASGLDGFTLPEDSSLIVSVHAYSPYNFAMNENGTTSFDPDDVNSTGELTWLADTLYDRFVSKGTGVIIGECGTVNKNNLSDRINWAGYFPKVFGEKGIRIFLWDNNAYGYGNEKFGLLHRDTLAWEFPDYIKKLVRTAKNYNK